MDDPSDHAPVDRVGVGGRGRPQDEFGALPHFRGRDGESTDADVRAGHGGDDYTTTRDVFSIERPD
ncbi:MAG TPA: hypothetical protein VEA63_06185 [Opitutus sp.]|nr:hypothetical protein [Opitutus sp.]